MIKYNKKIKLLLLIYIIIVFYLYNNYYEDIINNSIILPLISLIISIYNYKTENDGAPPQPKEITLKDYY